MGVVINRNRPPGYWRCYTCNRDFKLGEKCKCEYNHMKENKNFVSPTFIILLITLGILVLKGGC